MMTVDDQDGRRLLNTSEIHLFDHGNQHGHSEGIRYLRPH